MRFDDRFLEEIKSRVRLSDVIGKTVKLKRQGREFVGLSPFTKERSPSFFVNDDKGFFHDFSSGKHGDLISFLQETERLSFVEAVERLAGEAGMQMPAPDPQAAEREKEREGLAHWLELAAAWFEGELRRPAGKEARDYLARRGLPEQEWARFRLGFSPNDRTALKDYLIAKGARAPELVEAGLLIAPEDGGAPYDRFRDRIMFPITDARGRIVSFGGRAMDPEARAKYLNGPETSVFSKGRLLYGLYEARKLLHSVPASDGGDAPLVVVEGYMDVIACQRASIAAVAPMGTALTEEQMEVLWRLHPEPTLCFDGDGAGRRAASRAIDRALPLLKPGKSFRFALVTGGKDPDDVLREQGPGALKAQMAQTTPFADALFVRERDQEALDTPEHRAGLKQRLREKANSIADKDLAQAYRDDLLGRFDGLMQSFRPQRSYSSGGQRGSFGFAGPIVSDRNAKEAIKARLKPFNAAIAAGALRHPEWLRIYDEAFERVGFGEPSLRALSQAVFLAVVEGIHEAEPLAHLLASKGFASIVANIEKVAAEIDPPFLLPSIDRERAQRFWVISFNALVELDELRAALTDLRRREATVDTLATERRLRNRIRALEKSASDRGLWDQPT